MNTNRMHSKEDDRYLIIGLGAFFVILGLSLLAGDVKQKNSFAKLPLEHEQPQSQEVSDYGLLGN